VAQIYLDLLNRAADAGGLATLSNALAQGATRNQVVLAIEGSTEYRMNVVERLYNQFLHRTADATGLGLAVQYLNTGGTAEQLAAVIAGSPEYLQSQGGGTNDGFLSALYQSALGRAIDPSGQAGFSEALASGLSRIQVAAAIFSSTEYRQNLVQSYYQAFLLRPADPGGLGAFVGALQGGVSDEEVIAAIVGSEEYLKRLQAS
jgi:hypothetical protein